MGEGSTTKAIRKARTIEELLYWLIIFNNDVELQAALILTYRVSIHPDSFIESLSHVLHRVIEEDEISESKLMVYFGSFLHLWGSFSPIEWKSDPVYMDKIMQMAKRCMPPNDLILLKQLCFRGPRRNRLLDQHANVFSNRALVSCSFFRKNEKRITKLRPKSTGFLPAWWMIKNRVVAEQLTLLEHDTFNVVSFWELLGLDERPEVSNIGALASRFHEVSNWVSTQVLSVPSTKHQTQTLKKFIKICEILLDMNNFQSLMQIMTGLCNVNVVRLGRAWAALTYKSRAKLKKIERVMSQSQNYHTYRQLIKQITERKKPFIPYIPLFLRDLSCTKEKTYNGRERYLSMIILGKQLLWFRELTNITYQYSLDVSVQKLLLDLKPLSDQQLRELSLACQPSDTDICISVQRKNTLTSQPSVDVDFYFAKSGVSNHMVF